LIITATISQRRQNGATVVYDKVGLGILRRGWFNLDLGWSLGPIASGFITLFTAL
jgi:hypothetical protein